MTTPSAQKKKSKIVTVDTTNRDLILNFSSIIKIQTELPHAYEVARFCYDRWLRLNDPYIALYWKARSEMDQDHFEHTEVDGKIEYVYVDKNPVLKEGKTQDGYNEKMKELNDRATKMVL